MADEIETTQHEFKAEIRKLLDILVHSLYTNKEIFLRELISNSSDALDKLRFESSRGSDIADDGLELEVRIETDQEKSQLAVKDTGIGMTRDELIENIGTIAHSGSAEFLQAASQSKDGLEGIIGKFGVGFYSVFMVAKEVTIVTKSFKKDEPAVRWHSDGLGTYQLSVIESSDPPVQRGTAITIHLRDDAKEYGEQWRLKDIIRRHSSFISFPIFLDGARVNTIPALWREPKPSITKEKYQEFYTFLTHDTEPPLDTLHIAVDAPIQYNAVLFIPKHGLEWLGFQQERPGLDLYIRRVLIQRNNQDVIAEYLSFFRGMVDSEDLPLNISRETLQENRSLQKISSNITKQALTHLQKLAQDQPETYRDFWKSHGKIFKLGYTDFVNRDKYCSLLRFNSSRASEAQQLISLDEYISRAKPGQKHIYFAAGPSREALALNPHLDIFKDKDIEVLYLYEPLDEFALEAAKTYKEFEFQSVEHADTKALQEFDSAAQEQAVPPLSSAEETTYEKMLARFKEVLGDRVAYVKTSSRLKENPCCLVSPDGQMTSSMHRILQIAGHDTSVPAKILEVNKNHPLIRNLVQIFRADPDDQYLTSAIEQLFESALLLDGYLQDPHALVQRIQKLLDQSSGWYLAIKAPPTAP